MRPSKKAQRPTLNHSRKELLQRAIRLDARLQKKTNDVRELRSFLKGLRCYVCSGRGYNVHRVAVGKNEDTCFGYGDTIYETRSDDCKFCDTTGNMLGYYESKYESNLRKLLEL